MAKRTYKRKPVRKVRKTSIPKAVYDGQTYIKVVSERSMIYDAPTTRGHVSIQWGSVLVPTAPQVSMFHRVPLEWASRVSKFRQYRIDRVDIEFHPLRQVSGSTDRSISRMTYSTSIGEIHSNLTIQQYIDESTGLRKIDPDQIFRTSVNVAKYYRQLNESFAPTVSVDPYTLAASHIRVYAQGYAPSAILGTVTATWYITCRQWAA